MSLRVFLVAAEPSGDRLGAGLMRALKAREPDVVFGGLGGSTMAEEGLDSPFDISELSILGFVEGVRAYPRVVKRVKEVAAEAAAFKPDVAVLIDSWGFTLRVAQALKAQTPDLLVVKYVAPQVWASRPGRAKTLAQTVDHLLSIMPLDAPYFEAAGLPTTFVGNPSLNKSLDDVDPARFRTHHNLAEDTPVLALLPGSRPSELKRVYPVFAETTQGLMRDHPDLQVVVPLAGRVAEPLAEELAQWPRPPMIVRDDREKYDAFAAATCALACSGTVTTELALSGCPMVVGYRLGGLSHFLIRRVITTPWACLLNIALGREAVPEFIQGDCVPAKLRPVIEQLVTNPDARARQRQDLAAALQAMGRDPRCDPAAMAAEVVLQLTS